MDKLTAMRTFVAVVNAGGFSNAALQLSIPKTRVSQRIQELESALSTRLLYRTTRVVSLTGEGRAYFEKCTQILGDIDHIEQTLSHAGETPTGRLRISSMSLAARYLLLPRLAEFQAQYPLISVNLSVSDHMANLNEAGLDCAIRGGALESSSLISRHIRDVGFRLFAASHWQPGRQIGCPAELAGSDLIKMLGSRDSVGRDWNLAGPGGHFVVDASARLETDDDQAALDAALEGAGIVLCADFAALPHLRAGRLRRILPDWSAPSRPIYAIYPTRRHPSAKLRCFLDWLDRVAGPDEEPPRAQQPDP